MSTSTVAADRPRAAAARGRGRLPARVEGTPGKLQLAALGAIVACLVFALLGGAAFQAWAAALDDAAADAAQLVRVQSIQTSLVAADAAAATGFLSGGIERPDQVAAYDANRKAASRALAEAAGATPDDAADLAAVNDALTRYTALIDQARATNRQQLPLGSAYLRQARAVLTGEIVPGLEKVSRADQQRVADAYGAANRASGMLAVAAVVVLAALVLVQLWLARRTHRVLNAPLAGATVGVLVALIVGVVALSVSASRAGAAVRGPYTASVALAQARAAAFDAKSQESLRLINRGNGAANEAAYKADVAIVAKAYATAQDAGADGDGLARFKAWQAVHDQIVTADAGNDWAKARDLAVGSGAGSSNAAFTAFNNASSAELATQAKAVSDDLSSTRLWLLVLAWLTLLVGMLAAVAAWWGISERLEEYR